MVRQMAVAIDKKGMGRGRGGTNNVRGRGGIHKHPMPLMSRPMPLLPGMRRPLLPPGRGGNRGMRPPMMNRPPRPNHAMGHERMGPLLPLHPMGPGMGHTNRPRMGPPNMQPRPMLGPHHPHDRMCGPHRPPNRPHHPHDRMCGPHRPPNRMNPHDRMCGPHRPPNRMMGPRMGPPDLRPPMGQFNHPRKPMPLSGRLGLPPSGFRHPMKTPKPLLGFPGPRGPPMRGMMPPGGPGPPHMMGPRGPPFGRMMGRPFPGENKGRGGMRSKTPLRIKPKNINPIKPKVPNKKHGEMNKPWVTEVMKNEILKKHRLHQKARKSKSTDDWDAFKEQRNKVTTLLREAKLEYIGTHPEEDVDKILAETVVKGTKNDDPIGDSNVSSDEKDEVGDNELPASQVADLGSDNEIILPSLDQLSNSLKEDTQPLAGSSDNGGDPALDPPL